jgi:hypothetical protein
MLVTKNFISVSGELRVRCVDIDAVDAVDAVMKRHHPHPHAHMQVPVEVYALCTLPQLSQTFRPAAGMPLILPIKKEALLKHTPSPNPRESL